MQGTTLFSTFWYIYAKQVNFGVHLEGGNIPPKLLQTLICMTTLLLYIYVSVLFYIVEWQLFPARFLWEEKYHKFCSNYAIIVQFLATNCRLTAWNEELHFGSTDNYGRFSVRYKSNSSATLNFPDTSFFSKYLYRNEWYACLISWWFWVTLD